jgi:hypothetical protein
LLLSGSIFDFAILKTSVISEEFRAPVSSEPRGGPGIFGTLMI